jgi:pimeloyl-ACP methyl ester carboxylesterase
VEAELRAGIEGAEVDCGHFVAEEAPAETLAALQRFLAA